MSNVLAEFEKYGTNWTDRNELVLKSGKVITNSNIIDLLKHAIVGTRIKTRRMPDGWKQFIEEIVDSDMSKDIFTKKTTRDDIKNEIKGREERHVPEEWEEWGSQPICFKARCASDCCKGEVVQLPMQPYRQRAYTI